MCQASNWAFTGEGKEVALTSFLTIHSHPLLPGVTPLPRQGRAAQLVSLHSITGSIVLVQAVSPQVLPALFGA